MKQVNLHNPLETSANDTFIFTVSSLDFYLDRPHRIAEGAIIMCVEGSAVITLDMKRCEIGKHSRIVILPQSILMIESKSVDFRTICFSYSVEIFNEACFRIESDFFGFLKDNFHYKFPPETFEKNILYIHLVRNLYEDRGNRFRPKMIINILQNFFLDTFDKVYRHNDRQIIKEADRGNEIYKNFIQLVHKYCKQVREVTFYANELSISTRYLTKIAQRTDKITPKMFIDNCVIQEIKLQLQSSENSIQQIARELNFPDQSYLTRFFKSRTGMTPGEYRKGGKQEPYLTNS
ncbi:helix-turn-helix domain-containing protein [Bacteroides sp. 519]|uniref:AraC family transcriptional regulator n=1 Tax=Bacteroides sp. 519 TaxID=2302937 RepID=UPI0013D78DCC|nr:helix-turn-helix domain-containing protein [Bacteroides sp. 519]NDV60334.1 AraC family transcriptional regulator [Bacteroides sp. 519]